MADTVHVHEDRGGGMGWLAVVAAVLLLAAVLWFVFGGGARDRDVDGGATLEVPEVIEVPADVDRPAVDLPEKVDVDVDAR